MGIKLSVDEQKEIAERTRRDPAVIMSFYEWYGRYKQQSRDDATAARLALAKQQELFSQIYEQKEAEYFAEVSGDYRSRLLMRKKWKCGQTFKTRSGIRVRSKIEKIIADFLFEQGLRFEYEPIVELNGYYVMPDFWLCDFGIYLEHFGLENEAYRQSAATKLERYRRLKLRVVCTYPRDEPDIEEVLIRKLQELGVLLATPSRWVAGQAKV